MSGELNPASMPLPNRAASARRVPPEPTLQDNGPPTIRPTTGVTPVRTGYSARDPEQERDDEVNRLWEAALSTPQVWGVCSERGSVADLWQAVYLAREAFGPMHELQAEVDVDPDTDDRRVVLDVTVDAPADDLQRRYGNYTREWVASVPVSVREWVRLVFHPLRDG